MEAWPTAGNVRRTLFSWFHNFTQVDIGFKPKDLADIRSPYVEYLIFSTFKSIQIASFIGGIIVRPIYTHYRQMKLKPDEITNNTNKIILAACKRIQGRILLAGIFSSPLLMATSIYLNNYTPEKLAQRCYEIRCNEEILTYDRITCGFGLIGWYWKRFQGAVDGINIAFFYTIFHLKFAKHYLNTFKFDMLEMKNDKKLYVNVEEGELDSESILRFARNKIDNSKESGAVSEK